MFSRSSLTSEHFLEFVENIAEGVLAPSLLPSLTLSELVLKAVETRAKAAAKRPALAKGILASKRVLLLLVARHARLVVDTAFALVTQSLIRIVDFAEFFLSVRCFVYIRMVLFR